MLERAIGRALNEWRRACPGEWSLTEAGQRAGFSSAKLSMMENALQPSTPVDIMALGYTYKVPTPDWQAVVELAQRAAQQRVTAANQGDEDFDADADFGRIHANAVRIRTFRGDLVPTILQTPEYTQAAMKQGGTPDVAAEVDLSRQQALSNAWQSRLRDNDPLELEAVVPESALRHMIGGPRTAASQLIFLMELSELPNTKIQVIPYAVRSRVAARFPFSIVSFPHRQHGDVVYVEGFPKGRYVEEPDDCERCTQIFIALQGIALNPEDSLDFIAELASQVQAA